MQSLRSSPKLNLFLYYIAILFVVESVFGLCNYKPIQVKRVGS